MTSEGKKAWSIGVVTIGTYIINYYLRNLLSIFTPSLLETGKYTVEHIALMSSTYMLFYAIGQLINGILGDMLSPKKMIFWGNALAGLSMIAFPFVPFKFVQIALFALLGFSLSMERGPLMKIISENTVPEHARLICVFFSFAGFVGPLIVSLLAMIFEWNMAFVIAGAVAIAGAVVAFFKIADMEKKGTVIYRTSVGRSIGSVFDVFKIENFIYYRIIACLVEIACSSISFWIPTYLTENLMFDKVTANSIFSGISTARAFMPFVALYIFRILREKDAPMMYVCFVITTVFFVGMMLADNKWLSIFYLVIAMLSISCISSLLWSIYIPSLGKTGKVSSANGVLDCSGYAAAAVANILFANVMAKVSWNGVFLLWASIGVIGFVSTVIVRAKKKA